MKTTALTLALALATATTTLAAPPIANDDLLGVLNAHVKAVQTRDLPALEKTITADQGLELILPNGKRMTTRKEFVNLHRDWFKETNWTWTFEPESATVATDMAVITGRTHYEERDGQTTTKSENWLTLIFLKEKDGWRLIHDQNTRLVAESPQ
jgi:ketosteroid isomerase-like protein